MTGVLRYPRELRVYGWVLALFSGLCAGQLLRWRVPLPVAALLLALPAVWLVEVYGAAHAFDERGVRRRDWWGRAVEMPWSEMRALRWSGGLHRWFVLVGDAGKIRVHSLAEDFDRFAACALERLPGEVLAHHAVEVRRLRAIAGLGPADE